MKAEYKRKCLYKITTNSEQSMAAMYESMWAYSIVAPGEHPSSTGRYRIRISKMGSEDFLAMMGKESSGLPEEAFSIQGYIEKWCSDGWAHTIDWIGDADASVTKIESDLNEMFRAFTTGVPMEMFADSDFIDFPPSKPPKPPKVKPVKIPTPEPVIEKEEEPDFDWI